MLINTEDSTSQKICAAIDSINHTEFLSDSSFVTFIIKNIGGYFRRQGQQSNAIDVFSEAVSYLEQKESNPQILLKLYLPLGAAFEEVGLWSSAMEYYHKALLIAQDNNMQGDIARIYNNIGAAYYPTDIEKSKEYINKSLKINSKIGDKQELFINYNNLAAINVKLNAFDEALDYALQALQMVDKEEHSDMYHSMQCNIGSLYLQKGEIYLAISYINNAKDFFEKSHNYSELVTIYTLLIEAYEKSGIDSEAAKCVSTIENDLLHKISNSEVESKAHITLSDFYKRSNNYVKAYDHLKEATALKDSLVKANDKRKVNNLERIYDNEQKLRENAKAINNMQISKLKTDRTVTVIIIALIALIIIIIFLITLSQLQQKRHKANTQLVEQQIALQEKENELQQIKEQELNRVIDQKNRELSSYALTFTKDNEFLEQLSEELKQLLLVKDPRDKEYKERIRNILSQVKQRCNTDNWQEFKYYFEQVHPSFYDRLEEISPGITQRQKRLCAMLYIGLSTKEISSITFREIRSIESARNRLRKKLEVPNEESIQEFLSRKLAK
ncbi:MAG: hypothetical protein IKM10_03870 [Bacteroidaceae bacterium]|nr:hypothetical protein [Bacteroidaceae bacterium]